MMLLRILFVLCSGGILPRGEFCSSVGDDWSISSVDPRLQFLNFPLYRASAAQALLHPWIKEMADPVKKGEHSPRQNLLFSSPQSVTFKKYLGMQKLKKAAITYIATHVVSDDVAALEDVFKKIDVNRDGTITLEELDKALKDGE